MTPADYEFMYNSAVLTTNPTKLGYLAFLRRVMLANEQQYQLVRAKTGIPWLVVAAIHYREASQSFTRHLHNGDPLTARTVHVPVGRPMTGNPPFEWTDSATDALQSFYWRPQPPRQWDVTAGLEYCERYNGMGYAKAGANSPYVWNYTDKYAGGLFVADGKIDPTKQDAEAGVAAIFKYLEKNGTPLDFLA